MTIHLSMTSSVLLRCKKGQGDPVVYTRKLLPRSYFPNDFRRSCFEITYNNRTWRSVTGFNGQKQDICRYLYPPSWRHRIRHYQPNVVGIVVFLRMLENPQEDRLIVLIGCVSLFGSWWHCGEDEYRPKQKYEHHEFPFYWYGKIHLSYPSFAARYKENFLSGRRDWPVLFSIFPSEQLTWV